MDLIIVNKGSAIVNIDTGEIVTIDDSAIISTMAFCINVYEAAFDNSVAESSDEYIALNDALKMANAEYKEVIRLSKSYAVGDANNIRENENFDNSKYYSKLSHASADNAEDAKIAAENAQSAAETAQQKAEEAQNAAKTAQTAAEQAQQNAEQAASTAAQDTVNNTLSLINDYVTASQESAINAANSEKAAATSVTNAKVSEQAAANSATNAYTSETKAFTSEANASASEANALGYMDIAKSYAVGGTSIRENEDMDNAKYYYELANSIAENLNSNMATVDEVKEYLGI